MDTTKFLKTVNITAVFLLFAVTTLLMIKSMYSNTTVQMLKEKESFERTSEYFYQSDDDNRLWHVINRYSSDDTEPYRNSEYTFTNDSVTMINNYPGLSWEEFTANK